ncbi:MAG: DUF1848 domain-containing protein [Erysipelotrichaceae bacterium]|nr:DUF1848 domain-containing protein [Erysipelotrichaceae bacterium]
MILNTGNRTDIPAFYSKWFMNRIHEGFVLVRNPNVHNQVIKYDLDPKNIEALIFCSKNPEPMLRYMDELKRYRMFWFVTITSYGKDIEPNVPDKNEVIDTFQKLSDKIGHRCMSWRYDPVFLSDKYSMDYHFKVFEAMAERLDGYTDQVVISYIDLYEKTKRNFPEAREVDREKQIEMTKYFVEVAGNHHMKVRLCHESEELAAYGADVSGCLSKEVLEEALGEKLIIRKKPEARQGCACLLNNDIGAYNSCGHLCRYCYANYDSYLVKQNMAKHDPDSPLLIGNIEKDDVIKESRQESVIDERISLF